MTKPLKFSESITVAVPPDRLYAMVTDITRTGEWSPICTACWWDEGDGPRVGAMFTGRNEADGRMWETRSEVVAAEPGQEFSWEVNGGWVRWGFTFQPADGGTLLTEHWEFLPRGVAGFHETYGDDGDARIAKRSDDALQGIPATLAAIKKIAEAG